MNLINDEHKIIKSTPFSLNSNFNINATLNKETLLTSCFKYYYGDVKIINTKNKNKNKTVYSLSLCDDFLNIVKYNKIIIIDYPNVIYILYNKYKNINIISDVFYKYLFNNFKENNKIIIISKGVFIDNENYSIERILNLQNNKNIKLYENNFLSIFNINYKRVSSNIDDLLSNFICFVIFVYIIRTNKNIDDKNINIELLTNDEQGFDKNLFGKTDGELKYKINYIKDLYIENVTIVNNKVSFIKNILETILVTNFCQEFMTENIKNTQGLECTLTSLIEMITTSPHIHGYFRKKRNYNHNFQKTNITKKQIPKFDYNNTNKIQRKHNKSFKLCKNVKQIYDKKNNLKKNYYLYAFIKYTQTYLNSTKVDKTIYGNFYGNFSKPQILEVFTD